ncbi:MAG TPA: KUP/HAK/KT family potassium transporter [Longimicrobiales bacterium]
MSLLALGSLGIVFGDLGTNGLFALRAAFHEPYGVAVARMNVLGVLSLATWALIVVPSIKYLVFVMRAHNRGEGGTLALLSLLAPRARPPSRRSTLLVALGLLGAALIYGDGVITPAISVLAAIEGIAVERPGLEWLVVPVTLLILVALFLFQRRGTGRVAAVFGPVMLLWFLCIAALGLTAILRRPEVLAAIDPRYAARLLFHNGAIGFPVLGAIVLTVAGSEALYADVGHFGVRPIRRAWYAVVFPALLLNYFGQGAILLADPRAAESPFYRLVPHSLHYPAVALATAATIIASQALISASFSITRQAIQLGFLPRTGVRHTSATIPGRVYVPAVNFGLMATCLALVLTFRESARLAAAYGMAVAGAMACTTILFYSVTRERWRWGALRAGALAAAFLLVDLSFVGTSLLKIPHGAWVPLAIAGAVYLVMTTWRCGRDRVAAALASTPVEAFLRDLARTRPIRVAGTAVFLMEGAVRAPPELTRYLHHAGALHRQVILMALRTEEVPAVPDEERIEVESLPAGLVGVTARYGFRQTPNPVDVLLRCRAAGVPVDPDRATYFLGQITLIRTRAPGMSRWRKALFALLWRNAEPERAHFRLRPAQVVEIGTEVEL